MGVTQRLRVLSPVPVFPLQNGFGIMENGSEMIE
jgi:hypothetical protein